MNRYQYFAGRFVILLASILVGIPMGILIGTLYFLRIVLSYPFTMYNLAVDKWENRVQIEQADMWTRHISRMEQNQKNN
jgi:hypothetical protein|tara:strand:- start:259 stop:495 length:237 start_codon:yes stop_codon:yes gene_type:complete